MSAAHKCDRVGKAAAVVAMAQATWWWAVCAPYICYILLKLLLLLQERPQDSVCMSDYLGTFAAVHIARSVPAWDMSAPIWQHAPLITLQGFNPLLWCRHNTQSVVASIPKYINREVPKQFQFDIKCVRTTIIPFLSRLLLPAN